VVLEEVVHPSWRLQLRVWSSRLQLRVWCSRLQLRVWCSRLQVRVWSSRLQLGPGGVASSGGTWPRPLLVLRSYLTVIVIERSGVVEALLTRKKDATKFLFGGA
jgi:hypothetical protein